MKIRLAGEITTESIVDGEGIRTVIWTQGCRHNCKECHNPTTHSFDGGFLKDVTELCEEIKNVPFQDGITLSGGDPLEQIDACLEIAKYCHSIGLNVWCYTGYTLQQIIDNIDRPGWKELITNIDVLVDGKFEEDKKDRNLKYKGSSNQNIIELR